MKSYKGKVVIAGGSGLIGKKLVALFQKEGYYVAIFTRNRSENNNVKQYSWDPSKGKLDIAALEGVNIVINLAGANIFGGRWTSSYKRKILQSRIDSTITLVSHLNRKKESVYLINASAIGIYPSGDNPSHEGDRAGNDFLANVCIAWEKEAARLSDNHKLCILRYGIVLSSEGGALELIAKTVKAGVGASLASGKQIVPWISIEDLSYIHKHVVIEKLEGVYNCVAPVLDSNQDLTQAVATNLNIRLWMPNVPAIALRAALGDFANSLINSYAVSAKKLEIAGYSFRHKKLDKAVGELLSSTAG